MENRTIFRNKKVEVIRNASDISFFDLTDDYNDTKGFTKNIRGLAKATTKIMSLNNDANMSFYGIVELLEKFNLKPHTYCGMD